MSQKDFKASAPATGSDLDEANDLLVAAITVAGLPPGHPERTVVTARARTALDHPAGDVRATALGALSHLQALGLPDLDRALNDAALGVRRRAVEAAVTSIQSELAVTDEEPAAAAEGGESDGGSEIASRLITALADDPLVAEVAAFGLGEFGPNHLSNYKHRRSWGDDAVAALESMAIEHSDPLCRESAVAALGSLHEGKETILAAMGDKATVRRRAVLALAPFSGSAVEAALEAARGDRDWQVRQAAEDQQAARPVPD